MCYLQLAVTGIRIVSQYENNSDLSAIGPCDIGSNFFHRITERQRTTQYLLTHQIVPQIIIHGVMVHYNI